MRAAYIEVVNAVLKIVLDPPNLYSDELFSKTIQSLLLNSHELITEGLASSPKEAILILDFERYSSLYRSACGLQAVLATAVGKSAPRLRVIVEAIVEKDSDTACFMIETIPAIWSTSDLDTLKALADLYVAVLLKTVSAQVQSITCRNLATVLDQLTGIGEYENPTPAIVDQFTLALDICQGTPELSNARIRLSGSLLICQVKRVGGSMLSGETIELEKQLREWGNMLSDSGHANNVSLKRRISWECTTNTFRILILATLQWKLWRHFTVIYKNRRS